MIQCVPVNPQHEVELAVIINSFNRCQLLREALPSIISALEQISQRAAIVIFDAGSTDGSVAWIQQQSATITEPQIIYLPGSEFSGTSFSAGCNAAIAHAGQLFPQLKYCLFFETDNFITNHQSLPLAIQLLEQEAQLAAVGFTVERFDHQPAGFGCRFPTPLSFLLGQQLSQVFQLETVNVKWNTIGSHRWGEGHVVYTSPLLVRYSAWLVTGGMDTQKFPFSDSDNDWCWTVYKLGWRLAVLDVPGVIHDNRTQLSAWSGNRVIDFHRARLRLLLKHQGWWIRWMKPLLLLRHCVEFCVLLLRSQTSEQAKQSLRQRQILIRTVFRNYEMT